LQTLTGVSDPDEQDWEPPIDLDEECADSSAELGATQNPQLDDLASHMSANGLPLCNQVPGHGEMILRKRWGS